MDPLATKLVDRSFNVQERKFADRARIEVKGGGGGSGCSSFERTRAGLGRADGGNGGNGGDVILRAVVGKDALLFERFHFTARSGTAGSSEKLLGRRGKTIVVEVPTGTVVRRIVSRDADTGARVTEPVCELLNDGDELVAAKGGRGGFGNRSFASGYRKQSQYSSLGDPGWFNHACFRINHYLPCFAFAAKRSLTHT
jgi:GTP-binding protein